MPQEAPKVSIVTRTRDRHILLGRAIESVLAQTMGDWEHIIVNDGGDAGSLEAYVGPYRERYAGRLTLLHHEKAVGMQAASNAGMAQARGNFAAIHDDDDSWHPDFLAACVDYLEQQGPQSVYQGVATHVVRVWEDIDAQGSVTEVSREPYQPLHEVELFRVPYENPFPPIAFVYRRAVHDEIGGFDQGFDVAGDMDFNVRFLLRHEIGIIPRPLAYYHWRRNSSQGQLHNSVTANAREHGRRLNEWLNQHLRDYAQGDPARAGLALNIGHYAVAIQGRVDRALERIEDLKRFLESVGDGLRGELAQLPDHGDRLRDLKEHLGSFNGIIEDSLAHSRQILGQAADLKIHLASISGLLVESLDMSRRHDERGADLKEHLGSLSGMALDTLAQVRAQDARAADLKEHLNSLSGLAAEIAAQGVAQESRAADLKEHLGSLSGIVADIAAQGVAQDARAADLKEHLNSLSGVVADIAAQGVAQDARAADLKEHLGSLTGIALDALANSTANRAETAALREQTAALREQVSALHHLVEERWRGVIRIGPLRIAWKRRRRGN